MDHLGRGLICLLDFLIELVLYKWFSDWKYPVKKGSFCVRREARKMISDYKIPWKKLRLQNTPIPQGDVGFSTWKLKTPNRGIFR